MAAYRDIVRWLDNHREIVLDCIRIYLGIGLFVRGVLFISAAEGVAALVDLSEFSFASAMVVHYVTFVHLLGGLMLAVGLLTRLVALLQVPILVGAVFLVHWQDGLLSANQSLEFSALVLFLLLVVLVFGAGRWSADYYVFVREPKLQAERELESWWRTEEEERREPVPAGGGGVATLDPATAAKEAVKGQTRATECECGYDINHPQVIVEPRYGWTAGFFFMLGISAPVKEVVFYCQQCGTILKRSRDPEIRMKYRWHTS